MADLAVLDRVYDFIMRRLIAEGRAPHHTEIAAALGVPPPEGPRLLRELMAVGLPNWLHPDTDLIASFPPFNNLPTQYRLGVAGEWKWFAQCGLEALAACWAFPGRTVEIKAPCLDCGQSIEVAVRDGRIERAAPSTTRFYVSVPVREWRTNIVYT
jgi:Alkylmercury lyase